MSVARLLSLSLLVSASVFAAVLTAQPRSGAVARLTFRADEWKSAGHSPKVLGTSSPAGQADYSAVASITILPDLAPFEPNQSERAAAEMAGTDAVASDNDGSSTEVIFPDPGPRNRAAFAALRLKAGLSQEMLNHFDLFLYVSKASHGPLAQRMYVFRKEGAEDLTLIHDWTASTGREQQEVSPRGRKAFTATPRGYYQIDPQRMYRSYQSYNWDQPMPHAMFFNWERNGKLTGLAIHAANEKSLKKLGRRASAGCVQLSPENAESLFNLIRDYRGQVPRFAYNAVSRTMSNDGAFLHDSKGRLKMAEGYRVLVFIEDYGGKNIVAALDDSSNPL